MQWREQWAAAVVQTGQDRTRAVERLETGLKHLAEAGQILRLGFPDVALLLAEAALVNGADAVLRLHGFQVASHQARFAYPWLPLVYTRNPGLLARIRTVRNETQYEAAGGVSSEFAEQTVRLARHALDAVSAMIA
jgi:hypothetical protein